MACTELLFTWLKICFVMAYRSARLKTFSTTLGFCLSYSRWASGASVDHFRSSVFYCTLTSAYLSWITSALTRCAGRSVLSCRSSAACSSLADGSCLGVEGSCLVGRPKGYYTAGPWPAPPFAFCEPQFPMSRVWILKIYLYSRGDSRSIISIY